MYSIRTTYTEGEPESVVEIFDADGTKKIIPYSTFISWMEQSRPPIETPVEQIERDVVGLLFLLFQHKRAHPVVLDGKAIGTDIGYSPATNYFHYINGHVLDVDAHPKKCVYKNLPHVRQ